MKMEEFMKEKWRMIVNMEKGTSPSEKQALMMATL